MLNLLEYCASLSLSTLFSQNNKARGLNLSERHTFCNFGLGALVRVATFPRFILTESHFQARGTERALVDDQ